MNQDLEKHLIKVQSVELHTFVYICWHQAQRRRENLWVQAEEIEPDVRRGLPEELIEGANLERVFRGGGTDGEGGGQKVIRNILPKFCELGQLRFLHLPLHGGRQFGNSAHVERECPAPKSVLLRRWWRWWRWWRRSRAWGVSGPPS